MLSVAIHQLAGEEPAILFATRDTKLVRAVLQMFVERFHELDTDLQAREALRRLLEQEGEEDEHCP